MNDTFDKLLSNVSTAIKNGNAISEAYENAIKAGLEDDQFRASTTQIFSLLEDFIIEALHVRDMVPELRQQSSKTHPNFIRDVLIAKDVVKSAVRKSETAKERMQAAVASATERQKARDDAAWERQNATEEKAKKKVKVEEAEEPSRKKARKEGAKEQETRSKPGATGSNA